MNKQELIKKYEYMNHDCFRRVDVSEFLGDLRQLDEPKLLKLKDVIARIKKLDLGTQKVWLDEILNELGSDYGTLKYKDGYGQGKLEGEWVGQQLKDADKIRQELNKPVIPQFVADWIKYCKNTNLTMTRALIVDEVDFYNYANQKDKSRLIDFLMVGKNQEIFARAWLDGYTIEKKRYLVKMKGIDTNFNFLNRYRNENYWIFSNKEENTLYQTHHTRKELEDAGFGWMFDCEGIEIKEVE